MKKLMFVITIVICFTMSNSFAQSSSKSFKSVSETYNIQVKQFFIDVFELQKTGEVIKATMEEELETKIFEAFLVDFNAWKEFTLKHQGNKKFVLQLKGVKGFETESKEYTNQFKAFQKNFVDKRLTWSESELTKVLTKEEFQKYIDPVMKKFEDRTKKLFEKLAKT